MSLDEYLKMILDDEEIEIVIVEPAFSFNLESYEDSNND